MVWMVLLMVLVESNKILMDLVDLTERKAFQLVLEESNKIPPEIAPLVDLLESNKIPLDLTESKKILLQKLNVHIVV
jgi:hypothetical protein